jgi:putative nucleotidyltransferase with HDIG domain
MGPQMEVQPRMIDGIEDKMRSRVLRESAVVAMEEWADFLSRLDVPFFNYRGSHIIEVVRIAKFLARETGADHDVVVMAAWFHDIAKPSTTGGDGTHHTESAIIAREYLLDEGLEPRFVERVCDAIEKHDGRTQDEALTPLEAQIVWESDKLSKLGLTGLLFNLFNGLRYEPNCEIGAILENRIRRSYASAAETAASMKTEPACRLAGEKMRNHDSVIKILEAELRITDMP